MTFALAFAGISAMLLAFANGANDNSKGVATLIGAGLLGPRAAILYATTTTFLGSVLAIFLAGALLKTFSGSGIVADEMLTSSAFPLSVAIAAGCTVLLATRFGIPVSTTHAIVGAMVGVGFGGGLLWGGVWTKFAWPLLAAPLLAAAVTAPVYLAFRWTRIRCGITRTSCVCMSSAAAAPAPALAARSVAMQTTTLPTVRPGHLPDCQAGLDGRIMGVDAQSVLDRSHLLTAGAVSFARGVNDTPKIAAILLAASALSGGAAISPGLALVVVGTGIALGGLLAARRVAVTMSEKITEMNDGQAFTANLVTAILVIFASKFGVPVSTTHVSCGSLFGIGAASRQAHWGTISGIVAAWITTLPVAAVLGWLAWGVLH